MAEHVSCSGVNLIPEIRKKTTLLHVNASKGLTDIVNSLIETGADINGKDENNRTPLHCSVENGHKDIVEILLKAGANVNAQDDQLQAPLHVAVYWDPAEIVETLLKAGANVGAADETNMTPLHYAAERGHAEIVETLLKAGANVDAAGYTNKTPLHYAAEHGHAQIVETLFKAGANVEAECELGHTPLFYSTRYYHHEVSECLLKFGAKQGVWKGFVRHVSSALSIKTVSDTQSTKTFHVLRKSTEGVSSHSEHSHTSIMTSEPRDGHTDVTPNTAFANGSSTADCLTLPPSGMTTNGSTVISDDTEAITSVLPLGLSLQECEDFGNRLVDHLVKFPPLQQKSHKGKCSTDFVSLLENGNIIINIDVGNKVVQNYAAESLHVGKTDFVNVNSKVKIIRTKPADIDEGTDDSESSDNGP